MNIKELTNKAEIEQYAVTPPSGRGTGEIELSLDRILPNIKSISLRKPFAMIVGSMATQGKSNNDIDIVVRGEDLSDKVKEAINFRIYRLFTDIIKCAYDDVAKYVHIHYNNAGSYTSYIPLYELNLVPTDDFKIIQMSHIPFALRGNIDIINKSDGPRIIAGYANVAVVDSDEQFIPVETLKKGIQSLLLDPHYSNLMLVHQNIQIGKIINKFGEHTTHVDEKGLFIVCEIRKDLKTAEEVWQCILKNEINGFSIGCEVLKSHQKCDDTKCVTVLDEINIFEVSVCTKPVNEESGFIVISKSKFGNVCDECIIQEEIKMTKKEETNEVKTEEIKKDESQPSDKIIELEKKINVLETQIQEAQKPKKEPITPPPATPPAEEKKPAQYSAEEDMAIFMLDYIINNPKAKAQDIVKAWIESKKGKAEPPKKEPEEEPKPSEPKPSEPSQYPYPEKMGEVVDKLSAIVDKLTKFSAEEELKLSIKARDDQINALKGQVEVINKAKVEPKTIQEEKISTELEKDTSYTFRRGEFYKSD